jgi:hypothetical protein
MKAAANAAALRFLAFRQHSCRFGAPLKFAFRQARLRKAGALSTESSYCLLRRLSFPQTRLVTEAKALSAAQR